MAEPAEMIASLRGKMGADGAIVREDAIDRLAAFETGEPNGRSILPPELAERFRKLETDA